MTFADGPKLGGNASETVRSPEWDGSNVPATRGEPPRQPNDADVSFPREAGAFRSPAALARFAIVAVCGLALDLWSKDWAFRELEFHKARVLIPGVLEFQTVLNPGALFGIGSGYTSVFVIASVLALTLVLWMFSQSPPRRWLFQIALGGILAGALGNMYDRITVKLVRDPMRRTWRAEPQADGKFLLTEFPHRGNRADTLTRTAAQMERFEPPVGYVRDFIKIPTTVGGRELWPWVFNVADMLLVGGVSILAISLWTEGREARRVARTDSTGGPGQFDAAGPAQAGSPQRLGSAPATVSAEVQDRGPTA